MNLLPEQYVERSKNKARSGRVAVAVICTLCALAAVATHSRLAMNTAVAGLVTTQARANSALEVEIDASSLEKQKGKTRIVCNHATQMKTLCSRWATWLQQSQI